MAMAPHSRPALDRPATSPAAYIAVAVNPFHCRPYWSELLTRISNEAGIATNCPSDRLDSVFIASKLALAK
ncbi:hypothetical protein D3C71_1188140 [compost metagenome]